MESGVSCESCHGPGSELVDAIEGLDPIKDVEEIARACKENFLDFSNLPAGAKSLICLKCHTANATFNLHDWNSGAHALSDVSCFPCHNIHAGPDLITSPLETKDMCFKCHLDH